MPALTKKDLRARVRRLEELSRLLSIDAALFKDVDVTTEVSLHYSDRTDYREALHEAIRGLERARVALVGVAQRPGPLESRDAP